MIDLGRPLGTALIAAAMVVLPIEAQAGSNFAILVGVSDYDDVFIPNLAGPANDAALLYQTLSGNWAGSDSITVLANGRSSYPGSRSDGEPTRANILAAMNTVADQAVAGDAVILAMSGHGAQMPVLVETETEPDGLDEIFLAADFAMVDDGDSVTVSNHLKDDEIGIWVGDLLTRGISVWLVVDTCHSGTFERSIAARGTARFLDLSAAGPTIVDGNASADFVTSATQTLGEIEIPRSAQTGARFVAFYAAEAGQKALELPFPDPVMGGTAVHGVLTYNLVAALNTARTTSFADLARTVRTGYWSMGGGLPDPVFVGDLQSPLWANGMSSDRHSLAWSEQSTFTVSAGLLHGLERGGQIDVFAQNDPDLPLFTLTLDEVGLSSSLASRPDDVELKTLKRLNDAIRADGLDPDRDREAWLADRAETLVAVASAPELQQRFRVAGTSSVRALLTLGADLSGQASGISRSMIDWVEPGFEAEVHLRKQGEDILLEPGVSANLPGQPVILAPGQVSPALDALARSRNIFRLARQFSERPIGQSLQASVGVMPANIPACADAAAKAPTIRPGTQRIVVNPCDEVTLTFTNTSSTPLDISPFYLDALGSLYYLSGYAEGAFLGLRIPPGESRDVVYIETSPADGKPYTGGDMYILAFAVTASTDNPYPVNFRFLESITPPAEPVRSGQAGGDVLMLLSAAAYPGVPARSVQTADTVEGGAVIIPLRVAIP